MVHTIQHDGQGSAPGWLVESIADACRLYAGLAPPHWRKPGQGKKEKGWEDGYDAGARFLAWLVEDDGGIGDGSGKIDVRNISLYHLNHQPGLPRSLKLQNTPLSLIHINSHSAPCLLLNHA